MILSSDPSVSLNTTNFLLVVGESQVVNPALGSNSSVKLSGLRTSSELVAAIQYRAPCLCDSSPDQSMECHIQSIKADDKSSWIDTL
jgi:hypothetical protein